MTKDEQAKAVEAALGGHPCKVCMVNVTQSTCMACRRYVCSHCGSDKGWARHVCIDSDNCVASLSGQFDRRTKC